ncbi:MAG: PD40 domain-containing protein [Anaerolineae bacterium]|nr:PD40 domain-containing protein [Anaerolineae bacterium]
MNDETKQLREQTFNQIVLGLMLVGLGGAVMAIGLAGFSSPWFLRALALLIVALVAFLLHRTGRFMVAAYVLVLEMTGLVAGMLLQPNTIFGIVPFLFIPIVIIAGFLLTPTAILVVTTLAIALTLLVLLITGQLTSAALLFLTLPLGLTLLTALLVVGNALYRVKLADLLLKNRDLLRSRTREMLEAQQKVEQLQERVTKLQQQVLQAESVSVPRPTTPPADDKFYHLIRGTIRELDQSARNLETTVDKIAEVVPVNGWAGLLEETWHNVDHLASLVVNLEELTELEKGQIQLNNRPVDVATLVAELSSSARGLVRGKNIEIIEAAPEENPPLVADPDRIRQVMIYLIHNAIKYTDEGYIDIQAEVADDQEIIFSVSDSGVGLPPAESETVYETFGRSHDTAVKERHGAGLGLAISKRLIELQGGQAWNVSTPGIGSTFYFSIPLTPPAITTAPLASVEQEPEAAVTVDPAATLLSLPLETGATPPIVQLQAPPMQPVKPESTSSNLPPVARFSSTYITRFGLGLLGLLLIIGCLVAFLAFINQPTVDQAATISSTVAPSGLTSPAVEVAAEVSPTMRATATTVPVTTATAPAPSATATATVLSTTTPVPPTSTPTPLPSPSATATTTLPTTTPTLKPTSLIEVVNTPTPVTSTPRPTVAATAIETVVAPTSAGLSNRRLAFVVDGQMLSQQGLSAGVPSDLETVTNSRLSWSSNGDLLFTSERDGNRELYLLNAGDSQPRNLSQHPADDQQPAWSPDGRELLFSSGRDGSFNIYRLALDSGQVTRLTNSRGFDEWPAWSPDGQYIAFVSTRDGGNQEIYVMDRDGGNLRRLTNDPAADTTPIWSPDGRNLLFVSERQGSADLYLVATSGGEVIQLTADSANELAPIWSPDGRTIAFVVETVENADIFTLPAPTPPFTVVPRSAWRQITDTPARESYPTWGP